MSTGFTTAGRLTLSIPLAVVAAACVGGDRAGYTEPPATSYRQGTYQLTLDTGSIAVAGATVSPEFFTVAGVKPLVGRTFVAGDFPSSADVVVLSHQLWTERFDASPAVIGREVTIDERPRRVLGVMPAGFAFPASTQVWLPEESMGSS